MIFTVNFPVVLAGRFVTATATDPYGNTSRFSPAVASTNVLSGQTFTVINTNNSGAGSLRQAILDANASVTVGDMIDFNIPGTSPFTIAPLSALPTITDAVTIDG